MSMTNAGNNKAGKATTGPKELHPMSATLKTVDLKGKHLDKVCKLLESQPSLIIKPLASLTLGMLDSTKVIRDKENRLLKLIHDDMLLPNQLNLKIMLQHKKGLKDEKATVYLKAE